MNPYFLYSYKKEQKDEPHFLYSHKKNKAMNPYFFLGIYKGICSEESPTLSGA